MMSRESVISKETWLYLLERDDYMCLKCNREVGLQPAHYLARSLLGGEDPDNMMILCYECHRALHDGNLTVKRISGHFYFGEKSANWRRIMSKTHRDL